jgi:hypothetical protein
METVIDTFAIKSRGPMIIVVLSAPIERGVRLRRLSDGALWEVRGVERFLRVPTTGEKASLLLNAEAEPHVGDALERL